MLNPFTNGFFALQLVSHKVFRYAVPVFLIFVLLSSVFLSQGSGLYQLALGLQLLFYASAFLGWLFQGKGWGLLGLPLYFVVGNLAVISGFLKFLSGQNFAKWDPIRGT